MNLAKMVSTRSTCLRRQVGAILVKDGHIIASGYNGVPSGLLHCSDRGCLREERGIPSGDRLDICNGVHAEINAIIQAAIHGASCADTTLYVTIQPCLSCAKAIINANIKRLVYEGDYPDELARCLLKESSVKVEKWQERKLF